MAQLSKYVKNAILADLETATRSFGTWRESFCLACTQENLEEIRHVAELIEANLLERGLAVSSNAEVR